MPRLDYPVIIEPLSAEDGGGFAALVPDLPGCMSDGETPEEALASVRDAIAAWIEAATGLGRKIPKPSKHLAAAE
ncbi:MAG: type II toxin-antitoxin system HicB family antitoxin [Rhizobiales bacterium]|nr:type II toxin-antitoxin system HicB family antitoxin [Hyphomicrobiales bacterium]MBN9008670.1 type II toxin-antitoxin system HicB family antitoxin [Hyphomicrobiales bacterium]